MDLKLNTFTPTPPESRPGRPQAIVNASRRANRKGAPDPSKINAQTVRDALGQARDRVHFQKLLGELGLQAEFDRRGAAREIYGWRLRRQDAAEWFKASTLAKDLSWPKIAHHFPKADALEPIPTALAVAPTVTPAKRIAAPGDRMPAAVKSILFPPSPVAGSQTVAATGRPATVPGRYKSIFDLQRMERLEAGPLSTALLVLGGALVNFSVELAHKIIWFMQRLLAKFGLDMRPVIRVQESGRQGLPVLEYEPVAPSESKEVLAAMSNAATKDILKLVEAVNKKDPSLLPQAAGREEVAAAMEEEFSSATGAEIQPAETLAPGQSAAVLPPKLSALSPARAQTEAAPQASQAPEKTNWVTFEETENQFKAAHTAVQRAREKDIFYIDTRPSITRELTPVQVGLAKLEAEFLAWRGAHKVAAAFGSDPLKFGQRISNWKAEIARLESEFQAAEKKHAEFQKLWAATPEPVVPAALLERENVLIAKLRKHHAGLLSEVKTDLESLAQNPFLKSSHQPLIAKIRRIEGRFDQFLLLPQKNFLTDFQAVLQEVRMQTSVEKAKFSQPADWLEEAPAPALGQKGSAYFDSQN